MKRIAITSLSILLIFNLFFGSVYATDSIQLQSTQISEIKVLAESCAPISRISAEDIQDFQDFWCYLKDYNMLYLDSSGHLRVALGSQPLPDTYEDYLDIINFINRLIEFSLAEVSETFDIRSLDVTEETITLISQEAADYLSPIAPYYEPHNCGNPRLNVTYLCTQNYNELSNFYDNAILVGSVSPGMSPTLTTIAFWIGKVAEGCPWDYKTQPGYSPYSKVFCMKYGHYDYMHQNSEWLGNYNYGFTGSFLFNLDTLHWGSSAVSGFDPADVIDWPAIDEGYYDAP